MKVAVSGAGGSMGTLVAKAIAEQDELELCALYDPGTAGATVAGREISSDPAIVEGCDVVVEFTRPDVVMENLRSWRAAAVHAVVGTSGFTKERIEEAARIWGDTPPNLLIVPNFSIGAVLMMQLAELAAPHFQAAEIVELHHDRKADAPSGTAAATAERVASAQPEQRRAVESTELTPGALGASIDRVRVHSVRLPGLVAHQEVLFGNPGETLKIRHDTTDRTAFLPGVLLAIRKVSELRGVTVGLGSLLDE